MVSIEIDGVINYNYSHILFLLNLIIEARENIYEQQNQSRYYLQAERFSACCQSNFLWLSAKNIIIYNKFYTDYYNCRIMQCFKGENTCPCQKASAAGIAQKTTAQRVSCQKCAYSNRCIFILKHLYKTGQ